MCYFFFNIIKCLINQLTIHTVCMKSGLKKDLSYFKKGASACMNEKAGEV